MWNVGSNHDLRCLICVIHYPYGPIYREKMFPGMPEQVVIFHPDDVEKVYRADGEWPNRPEGGEVFMKIRKEAGLLRPGIVQLRLV